MGDCRLSAVLVLWSWSTPAGAFTPAQAHQRSVLPGVRAAALGGAYAALSDDPTGGYYNPAGMVFARQTSLSVSANAFMRSEITYENALNGQDFSEHAQSLYPSFAGVLSRFDGLALGYSYCTLDSREIDQADRFNAVDDELGNLSAYSRTHQESQKSVLFGFSASAQLSQAFGIGLSQYGYYRTFAASTHQLAELQNNSWIVADTKYEGKNLGLLTVVGLMLRTKLWSIGLVARLPRAVSDESVVHTDLVFGPISKPSGADIAKGDMTSSFFEEMMPRTYQLGLAWLPSSAVTLTSEVLYHEGVENSDPELSNLGLDPTVNFSTGWEWHLRSWALRMGAFTDNSMTRVPEPAGVNQPTHVDYVGASFGLGIEGKQYDLGVTVTKKVGRGKSQIISGRDEIQNVRAESESLVLGGRYSL